MAEALVADFGGQVACGLNGCWLPLPAAFLFPAKSANSLFRQFALPPICSSATCHRDPTAAWLLLDYFLSGGYEDSFGEFLWCAVAC